MTERCSLQVIEEDGNTSGYDKRSFVFQNFHVRSRCEIKAEKMLCLIQTRHQASVFFIATRKMGMEVLTKGVSFFKI
jgi:hypothetical protein